MSIFAPVTSLSKTEVKCMVATHARSRLTQSWYPLGAALRRPVVNVQGQMAGRWSKACQYQCFAGRGLCRAGRKGTHLLVLECVQPGIKFLLLEAQVVHLVKLFGVLLRLHHQVPAHLSNLFLPRWEGGRTEGVSLGGIKEKRASSWVKTMGTSLKVECFSNSD